MLYALNFAIKTKRDLETFLELEKLKAKFARWCPKRVTLKNLPAFVRTKGTVFMLMPGIKGLNRIAGT
jgi:hypothetical protein